MESNTQSPNRTPPKSALSLPRALRGQDGEVELAAELLADQPPGWVVDVGCGDGVLFSNSLYFILECGYQGLLIDPNQHVLDMARTFYRSHAIDNRVVFWNGPVGYSTMQDCPEAERFWTLNSWQPSEHGMPSINPHNVGVFLANRPVSLLSIDIEAGGRESFLFMAMNIKPLVIILENNDNKDEERANVCNQGYEFKGRKGVNDIYASLRIK